MKDTMRPPGIYEVDGVLYRAGRRVWTDADDAIIRARYPDEQAVKLLPALPGRSLGSVHRRARTLGVEKSEAFKASPDACRLRRGDNVGARTRFQPGQAPANKGTRRPGYGPGRMKETQFKKGGVTKWKPIGATRLVDGYLYRKVSDIRYVPWTRNWRAEHCLIWEAAHGPVPKKHNVYFLDGDRTHVTLDNLGCMSRADWMMKHTVHNLPKPIVEVVQLLGALKRKINGKERHHEQRHQRTEKDPVLRAQGSVRQREADGARSRQGDRGHGQGARRHRQG